MMSEFEQNILDSEKPEEYLYDSEKNSKFIDGIKTKNQFDNVEHSINHWHDGAVTAEIFNVEKK